MLKTKLLFFGIRLFVFIGLTHLQQCIMPCTRIYLSAFIYRRCDGRLVEDGYTRHHCGGRLVALPFTRTHHHCGHRLSTCLLPMPGVKYQRSGW